jgi:DNA-binding MarR family transcriptional regulator
MHPQGLLFNDLKELCALTDGNLSCQLQVLEEEGIVEIWKGSAKRRTQTLCRLSDSGCKRFLDYISVLESVVADATAVAGKTILDAGKLGEGLSPA